MSSKSQATEDDLLAADVSRALGGADEVRAKLISLLSIGPRDIESMCYAIKSRVKSANSLLEKIVRKRNGGDPTYNAQRATDIVGLRFLVVHSDSLLKITLEFLTFLEFCQQPRIQLVKGSTFADALKEIIIFRSKNAGAPYSKVHSALKGMCPDRKDGTKLLQILDADEDRPYSSIHIVFYCNGNVGGKPKIIPVEAQIRTIFEDAWNEVDHPIRYKGELGRTNFDDVDRSAARKEALDILKQQLENCGRQADLIKKDHFALISDARDRTAPNVATTMTTKNQFNVNSTSALSIGDIANKFETIEQSGLRAGALSTLRGKADTDEVVTDLNRWLKGIENLISQYRATAPDRYSDDHDFQFYSLLLKNFIKFRLTMFQKSIGALTGIGLDNNISEANDILYELEKNDLFATRSYLKLRIANCWRANGELDYALAKLKEAARLAEVDTTLKEGGFVRALINRQLAATAHAIRVDLAMEGQRVRQNCYEIESQQALLLEAINASCAALGSIEMCISTPSGKKIDQARELNNLIAYCWDLVELNASTIDRTKFDSFPHYSFGDMAEFIQDAYANVQTSAGRLDTICKAYILDGKLDKAKSVYSELSNCLANEKSADILSSADKWQLETSLKRIPELLGLR